jgi:hypothetical protein
MQPRQLNEEPSHEVMADSLGERREDKRIMTVYRVVRVRGPKDEGLARCRNISDSGAKLDIAMDLQLNDSVEIAFSTATLPARVVWVNGRECGVAFEQKIDSAALLARPGGDAPKHAERSPRLQADIATKVRVEGAIKTARINDISQRGMKLSHDGSFHAGLEVKVILAGGREKAGVIRWVKDNIAGVFLLEPFSIEELGSAQRYEALASG